MTADKFHDALTLLPTDLIAEADKKRTRKPKVISWKRWTAMAACAALILCCGLVFQAKLLPNLGGTMEKSADAVAAEQHEITMQAESAMEEEAAPAASAEAGTTCALPTAPVAEDNGSSGNQSTSTKDRAYAESHTHTAAQEPQTVEDPVKGWCGNTMAVLYVDGIAHTLWGSDAIALTDILINSNYTSEKLCRCMAEYTADTETESGYEISLTQSFVRFNGGQADLTAEQTDRLREIIASIGA